MADPSVQAAADEAGKNTLRLDGHGLGKVLADLDSTRSKGVARRRHYRWPFANERLTVEVQHAGGNHLTLALAARNISSGGVGLLHNAYMHPGTACTVNLPQIVDRSAYTPVAGKVVRCRHVRGVIHEVGIRFESPIRMREFVAVDPMQGGFTLEHVDPAKLIGSVLHVDDSAVDRRLVRHHLRDTQLTITTAEDGATAIRRAAEGFDIILCDLDLPDMSGADLLERLRTDGVQTPILMLTADSDPTVRAKLRALRATAFLSKPLTPEALLRALGEFLLGEAGGGADAGGPVFCSLAPDDPTAAIVPEYIEDLKVAAGRLKEAIAKDELLAARRVAFQLKGSAAVLGFAPIGEAAEAAVVSLTATGSVGESARPLKQLMSLCLRARKRAA